MQHAGGKQWLATRLSIAPWHLGILLALMRLFDLFVCTEGPFREGKVLASKFSGLCFQTVYTSRPFFVIKLFDLICYKPFVWHVWHPVYTKTSGNWFLPGHTLFQLMLLCWFTSAQPPSMFLVSRALGTGDTFALAHMWDAAQPRGAVVGMMTYLAHHTCYSIVMGSDGGTGLGIMTYLAFAHMWDATFSGTGLAMMTYLALALRLALAHVLKCCQVCVHCDHAGLEAAADSTHYARLLEQGWKGWSLRHRSSSCFCWLAEPGAGSHQMPRVTGDWPFSSNSKICTQACDSFLRRSRTHTQAVLHRQGLRCCYGKGLQWCWPFRPAASLLDLPTHRAQRKDGSHLWRFVPAKNWDLGGREKEKSSRVQGNMGTSHQSCLGPLPQWNAARCWNFPWSSIPANVLYVLYVLRPTSRRTQQADCIRVDVHLESAISRTFPFPQSSRGFGFAKMMSCRWELAKCRQGCRSHGKCCGEVLQVWWRSVVEKSVGEKCCRDFCRRVKSVVEKCWSSQHRQEMPTSAQLFDYDLSISK